MFQNLDHFALMTITEADKKLLHEHWRATNASSKEIVDAYLVKIQQYLQLIIITIILFE